MYRDADLLKLAQGQKCLLNVHPYCDDDFGETVVACHSNELIHGKGKGLKASDDMTVWGCYKCHCWLDQGDQSKRKKAKIFDEAWYRQVDEWHKIRDNPLLKPWKVEAATRVLKHIGAIKYRNPQVWTTRGLLATTTEKELLWLKMILLLLNNKSKKILTM